ncbi:MAG: SDR family NAD(P)-dependent oxidoreductase [Verrucomicrobiota bacterium]
MSDPDDPKRILITGATDGIGKETARMLVARGQQVLLHGRSAGKLEQVEEKLVADHPGAEIECYAADLSRMAEVEALAEQVIDRNQKLDVLINNAGVFKLDQPHSPEGLDLRFLVNTVAPYLLTKRLLPAMSSDGRVINLSSAAQAPVDLAALAGKVRLSDGEAYAQSKLALTMWSRQLALELGERSPAIIAVNPGSFLGSKMVKEAYGTSGKDLSIGAEILTAAALDDAFASASGSYFDNDSGRFAPPHPDALDERKFEGLVEVVERLLRAQG